MQGGAPFFTDGPVEIQSVRAALQSRQRFVVPHGHIQPGDIAVGDVGRVADDAVKLAETGWRAVKGIYLPWHDLTGQTAAADVAAADPQRALHQLTQHHVTAGAEFRHRQSHAAASGAQVQHTGLRQSFDEIDGLLRQNLGIGAGDQDVFIDIQIHAAEAPLADQVRQRLARQMAAHQGGSPLLHLLRHVQPSVSQQLLPGLAGGEGHQLPGLQRGGVDAGAVQLLSDIHIQIVICCRHNTNCCRWLSVFPAYHLSLPCSAGSTSFMASMATSSMESSGSLVVKFCIHMPGADRMRVSLLSWAPTARLNS